MLASRQMSQMGREGYWSVWTTFEWDIFMKYGLNEKLFQCELLDQIFMQKMTVI